jgi:hypothetical protein
MPPKDGRDNVDERIVSINNPTYYIIYMKDERHSIKDTLNLGFTPKNVPRCPSWNPHWGHDIAVCQVHSGINTDKFPI